jgi:uncharacterized protein
MGNMVKSRQNDYFSMFAASARIATRAARAMQKAFANETIDVEELRAIKGIEHEGDQHMHQSLKVIEDAFIMPLEYSDMIEVLKGIEDVTDSIDYIASHIYMMHVTQTDRYLSKFIDCIVESCALLEKLMEGLHQYKRNPKPLHELIVEINHFEEVGDSTYSAAMYELFDAPTDPIRVTVYRKLYELMEQSCDCVEDVADIAEKIIISAT